MPPVFLLCCLWVDVIVIVWDGLPEMSLVWAAWDCCRVYHKQDSLRHVTSSRSLSRSPRIVSLSRARQLASFIHSDMQACSTHHLSWRVDGDSETILYWFLWRVLLILVYVRKVSSCCRKIINDAVMWCGPTCLGMTVSGLELILFLLQHTHEWFLPHFHESFIK